MVKISVSVSVFLSITQMIVTAFGLIFSILDNAVLIDSPQVSLLDLFLIEIVMDEIYAFINFLRGYDI